MTATFSQVGRSPSSGASPMASSRLSRLSRAGGSQTAVKRLLLLLLDDCQSRNIQLFIVVLFSWGNIWLLSHCSSFRFSSSSSSAYNMLASVINPLVRHTHLDTRKFFCCMGVGVERNIGLLQSHSKLAAEIN